MQVTIDISMYPNREEFIPPIDGFIEKINCFSNHYELRFHFRDKLRHKAKEFTGGLNILIKRAEREPQTDFGQPGGIHNDY